MSEAPPTAALAALMAQHDLIDLSVMVGNDYPCYWPTIMGYHVSDWHRHDGWRGHYFTRYMIIEEHVGTHMDAPAHFIPTPESGLPHATEAGHITIEKVDLGQLVGPAVVVDCRSLRGQAANGQSPVITAAFLEAWQKAHRPFAPGEIVLLHTGWTTDFYKPGRDGLPFGYDVVVAKKAPGWPAPDGEAMTYLADLGVRTVGIDTGSMGTLQFDEDAHWAGLGRGMLFVERLVNLDKLPTFGATFLFMPIKTEGASGAPGRAVAWVPRA